VNLSCLYAFVSLNFFKFKEGTIKNLWCYEYRKGGLLTNFPKIPSKLSNLSRIFKITLIIERWGVAPIPLEKSNSLLIVIWRVSRVLRCFAGKQVGGGRVVVPIY